MSRLARLAGWLTCTLLGFQAPDSLAESLLVAVASNFRPAMEMLHPRFEARSGHSLSVSYGSTGRHYAQIVNGAPFDMFLAADAERPMRLEVEGIAVPGSRFTYAHGILVLWRPGAPSGFGLGADFPAEAWKDGLVLRDFRFLAIANPATAPYGRAAEQVLRRLELWQDLQPRLVRGENVGQVFAFVRSGQADLGFIAGSQLTEMDVQSAVWHVPPDYYDPIVQQAVVLKDSAAARELADFLRGHEARAVIAAHGYSLSR